MENSLGLSEKDLSIAVQGLSEILATTYVLFLKTQYAHWNVEGGGFYMLHKLLEGQYEELLENADLLAERIRALDRKVPATFSTFQKLSKIPEESLPEGAHAMITALLKDHETLIRLLRKVLEDLKQTEDEGTANLLADRLQAHEKTAWMLRS